MKHLRSIGQQLAKIRIRNSRFDETESRMVDEPGGTGHECSRERRIT